MLLLADTTILFVSQSYSGIHVSGNTGKTDCLSHVLAEDIRALVHSLGHTRVHLVGHDMGATVIYPYACLYPHEVASLTFVDVPALGIAPLPLPFDAWHFGFHQTPELPETLTAGRDRDYLGHFLQTGAISAAAFDAYVAAYSDPGAMKAGFEMYRAFGADAADNAEFAKTAFSNPRMIMKSGSHSNTR